MTSLEPRPPYSETELEKLYPKNLQLQQVQVFLRHGERTPMTARFQNTGLKPNWPYCNAARQLTSVIKHANSWDRLNWRRQLETFGPADNAVVVTGSDGESDGFCLPQELTDKGRDTTAHLGRRLRHLYVDQLGFMPDMISDSSMIYLRTTPLPRALESMQQAFSGMYPPSARKADFPPPTIFTRAPVDETLYPNDGPCRRFAQLTSAFASRTATRWNTSDEMEYLNMLIGKWMPPASPKVAVDGRPRITGILDTVSSTLAHGPGTRLPKEFYDPKARSIVDSIAVEEWYSGYMESEEYRTLGIGALAADILTRMTDTVERNVTNVLSEVAGGNVKRAIGQGDGNHVQFALSGCHDTTLAALLASLGTFDNEPWPPYASHVAFELFRRSDPTAGSLTQGKLPEAKPGWWSTLFGTSQAGATRIGRTPASELTDKQREKLGGYFVRVRYNDKVMTVPGCRKPGNHLEGDESFCTLEAFKRVTDKFTPKDWKKACQANLDKPAIPERPEPAGYE